MHIDLKKKKDSGMKQAQPRAGATLGQQTGEKARLAGVAGAKEAGEIGEPRLGGVRTRAGLEQGCPETPCLQPEKVVSTGLQGAWERGRHLGWAGGRL